MTSVSFVGAGGSGASQPQDIFFTWSLTLQGVTDGTLLSLAYGDPDSPVVKDLLQLDNADPPQTYSGSFSIHLDPGDKFTWILNSEFSKNGRIDLVVAVPEVGAVAVAPLLLAGGLFRWWRRRRGTGRLAVSVRRAAALLGVILLGAGFGLHSARAHNLDQRFTYVNLDPETLDTMRARVAAGQPAVQIGDTIGVILKSTPGPGTLTGVGGYLTFYLPTDGSFQVVGAEYLASDPSRPGYYMPVPIKGQSIIAIGSGPIGPATTLGLASGGALTLGPNILGVTEATVTAAGVHRGTIAGVYADTGIFYSTSPKTGWESWTNATAYGLLKPYLPSSVTTRYPDYLVNNRGESIRPRTYWDASQLIGFGLSSPHAPATDPNGRGSAPWGTANVVAGPESGYAWDFDLAQWAAEGYKGYSDPLIKNTLDQVGPWNRIKYPGSQISKDQAGLVSAALGYAGIDASNVGHDLSESTPLPPNTTAVRFSFGMLELGRVEVARVYVKVLDDFTTCPFPIHGDAFGGDAGGEQGGKDHLWRYYDPTDEIIDLCGGLQKSFLKPLVPPGATNTVTLTYFNGGHLPAINLAITDPLPSGITYLPNTAKVNGIPKEPDLLSPLTWYIGFVEPYDMVEVTFDVKVNTAGDFFNVATATSEQGTNHANDTLRAAYDDLLLWDKFVSPTAVAPGGTVNYMIEIDNVGTGPNGIPFVITEYLPAGFTYVSMVSKQINGALLPDALFSVNTSNPNQPIFTINQGIQAGKSLILTFKALVAADVPPGTYCNLFKMAYEGKVLGPAPDACVNVGGGSIGDTIWRDWDGDRTQDPGEEGIPGVTVRLYNDVNGDGVYTAGTDTLMSSQVTDADGYYSFQGLTDGKYVVVVDTSAAGLTQHTNTADPDGGAPNQAGVTLANNSGTDLIDFGYRPSPGDGSIGDKVFEDNGAGGATANDGIWNGSEPGIPNVTVNLYEDTNGNGEIDEGDLLIATTQSDASGTYLFASYAAGAGLDFIVDVLESDSDLSSYFTSQNKTWDSTTLGDYSVLDLAGPDLDNDFGFRGVDPASIGDTVFFDTDGNGIYTAGVDLPLAGIKVSIYYDANGDGVAQPQEFVTSKDTDATGFYQFSSLTPERYIVVADSADPDLPGGVQGLVPQYVVTLDPGQDYVDADFPFVELFTKTADKQAALPGDIIQYTLNLNLPGNQLYQDLTVCDPVPGSDVTFLGASSGGYLGSYTPTAAVLGEDDGQGSVSITAADTNSKDTWITEDQPTRNYGTDNEIRIDRENGKRQRGLLQFNSLGVPSFASVTEAELSLVKVSGVDDGLPFAVRRVSAGSTWDEGTVNDATGIANWTQRQAGPVAWTSAGGDFVTDANDDVVTVGTEATYQWDVTHIVQAWQGGTANQGFFIQATDEGGSGKEVVFGSSEHATAANRPVLDISYQGPVTRNSIAISKGSVAVGEQFKVIMTLHSDTAMTAVTPGTLTPILTGGAAATYVSGPTPVSHATLAANGTVAFEWTYQAGGAAGGIAFSGAASATVAGATYNFVSATSASSQVVAIGLSTPNTVCWNLGSHTQQQDGLRIAGASIYAFRGDSTGTDQEFWKYDPADGTWNSPTDPTDFGATLGGGGSLTTDGTYIYALQGDGTKVVKRYDPTANTWASLPSLADNVGNGGAIAYHAANGKLYALRGAGQKTFSQFTFTGPLTGTWIKTIAQLPQKVSDGGALVSVGNYLYALQGGGKRGFYRYDPAANVWLARALTPGNVDDGGALVVVDNYIYAFQGKTATFWRYDIAANTWTTMAAAPAAVGPGAALTAVGNTIFALRGNGDGTDTEFWRYSITANTWTVRSSAPAAVGWGGSLVKLGTSYNYETALDVSPAIVTSGNNVTVTYTVTASEAVTGFTPPAALGLSATGGATAIQQGAVNPSGPVNLDASKSQTFTYTYKITAGTPPTDVTFSVPQRTSGTGVSSSGAVIWPLATAHNVIAVPALTMEVKVVESPTGALVDNVATLDGIDKVGPNYCYIIANGSGANTDVDVLLKVAEDGSVTRIGLPGTTKAKSLVLSPDKTLLYTTDQDPTVGAGSDRFGTLDLATGVFTPINRLASTANLLEGFLPGNVAANFAVADVVGMSFNPLDGKLYAVARRENTTLNNTLLDLLFVIDPATGQHVEDAFGAGQDYLPIRTDLLTIPLYDIDDITFDTATGTLYAIASDSIADLGLSDRLVTINPATGAVADIGRITRSDTLANLDNVEGLTYYPGGGLHITTGGVTGETTPANTYWVLDATTAKAAFFDFTVGEGTHITDPAGNVYDFEGVACISDDVVIHATDNAVTSLKGAIGDLVWADINGDQTYDPAFTVTDGRIDFNTDGTANDNDDGILGSVRVIDGWLDMNGDNLITSADNGTFQGKTVIGGYLDMDGDTSGTILAPDATDDGSLLAESGIAGVRVYIDDGDGVFEWTDANGNGLWDAGEGEQWTLTAASGEYWLYGLADATYTVRYDNNTAPSGYVPTTSLTQSAIISTGTRVVETADFGLQPGLPPNLDSTIGDLVWVDRNENGIFDTGDEAIDQVTVRLYRDTNGDGLLDPDGADNTVGTSDDEIVIGATVTDAAGKYLFAGLNSGNYLVQVDQTDSDFPAGLALAGSSPAQPNPEAVSLGVKEDKLDVDFAYNYTASIGDFVWYDNNGNAAHDVGENGVPNANVMLFEDTNRNGLFDGDVDVQIDSTRTFFTVIDGKLDINADGSITEADDGVFMDYAIIDGLVDVNAMNGVTEADDLASLGGYPVVDGYLDIDRDGVTAGDTGDDLAAGEYLFDNLPAGTYFVQVYEQSVKPEGCLTGCSYFQLPTTDTMQKVVLNPNQAYLDADFGFKQGSTIEGSIFHDINHDSVFEPTQPGAPEPGLAGITVWIDADADGALDWVDGDSDGQWDEGEGEQWTETDANGDYKFFVTEIGSYLITYDVNDPVILAGKLAPTTPTALNTIITVLGEQKIDIDFGLDNTGVIGDLIFGDLGTTGTYDGAATDPGLANVVVELYADTDGDGSFDPAIDGYVATTVTDASGYYLFPGLPDGAFFTRVLPASIPLAWQTTPTVDPTSPMDGVGLASVINGGAVLTMDFGYPPQAPGSLTGTVYNDGGNTATGNGEFDYAILDGKIDLNRDGVISAADAGAYGGYTIIAGLVDWDSSGIVDTADTSPVGEYLNGFMVKNGCFDIDRDGTAAETTDDAIAGFPIITGKLDINRDGVVDGNDDGAFRGYTVIDGLVDVNGVGGITGDDDLADLAGYPIVNGYFDINRNSITGEAADVGGVAGDTAIAGVTINLYDSTGAWIASTVTDTNGFYRFDGLRPGSYTVEEVDPPGAYSVTDKELDTSDPAYNQIPAAVTAGATSAGNDFLDDGAYLAPISGQVRNDTDSNGNLADTDTGIPGVTIRLFSDLDGDGTTPLLSIIDGKIDMNGDGAITSADDGALFGVKIIDGQVDANNDGAITAADDLSSLNGIQVIDGLLDVVPAGNTADDDGTIGTEPLVATTVTDSSGYYTFPNLTFGDYVVVETDPANAVSTNDKTNDPLGPFGTDNQVAVALSYGGETGIDFLDSLTGTVSGFLYKDVNGDGVYTAGTDAPLSGVDVLIEDSTGNLFTVTTDVNGNWTATVPPGTTTASVVVTDPQFTAVFPGGYVQTDGTNPTTVNAVANTNTSMGNDGFFSPVGTASIAGQVRFDTDGNSDLNDPDAGIPGVVIELYLDEDGDGLLDAGEPLVKTTATDTGGSYSFPNLAFANYLVKEINPAGATSTMDKDANSPANGYDLIGVNLTSGGAVTQQDFLDTGLTFYSISGTVWNDTDQTGGFSTGDTPVSGVSVAVYADLDGDGLLSPDEIAAGPSAFTTTDASGNYTLTGLPNGNYVVLETDPVGVASVTDADGTSVNGANQIAVTINNASVADRDFLDTGAAPVAIGDYLWLDEDSDGVQDAGEAGIPNVRVDLYDASGNTPLGTTYTDANGGYLFTNASAGVTYSVKVATDGTGALPAGLASNPTHDLDGIGTPHVTVVTVPVGSEGNFSADFGYNWASTGDVTNPQSGATGAIGDRLWIDANNNGIQDAGEAGLGGVSVALTTAGPDGLFGTADDVTAATTTTAADGNYIFDGLAAGAYQVIVNGGTTPSGYTLMANGDPDGTADNKTTAPIVLGPGDVYVNADFGYVPNAGYAIGNVVFFDLDGDGFFEPNGADSNAGATADNEYGIAGVTVALYNSTGAVIATTITDAAGTYSFPGLPNGTYSVKITDTANVLAGLIHTTGTANTDNYSQALPYAVTLSGDSVNYADFGFAPPDNTPTSTGTGVIGDTIFLDRNGMGGQDLDGADNILGTADDEPGLEGVTVYLYDATGATLLATTVTDENGHYVFAGLDNFTYQIRVDTATLPGSPSDPLTNSSDPDGGAASQSQVILTGGAPNLDQDFGYWDTTTPNTITGTLWNDLDAGGVLETGETGRYAGVTVVLRDSNADIVATAVTDASGNYTFSGLPNGAYTVDVTDTANILDGLWHSLGTANTDDNSQTDPYTVTLTGNQTANADFGYYGTPAALGDFVWNDLDQDGLQDMDEIGIANAVVTLTVTWPDSSTTVFKTTTDVNGHYTYGNLLLDENYDGLGTGEPTYTLVSTMPAGGYTTPSPVDADGNDATDSDNHAGQTATVTQGAANNTYDFGYYQSDLYTISGKVLADADNDGLIDVPGDTPLAGVVVQLYEKNGSTPLATTVTDIYGNYEFAGWPDAKYRVVEINPSGVTSVTDSDGNANGADEIAVEVKGADMPGNNFLDASGPYLGSISGHVFEDGGFALLGDGDFGGSPTDTPIVNIVISLYNDLDNDGVADPEEYMGQTVTDSGGTGLYQFSNLTPGNYLVRLDDPAAGTYVTDADGPSNGADQIAETLTAGEVVTGRDFLVDGTLVYSISGSVLNDADRSGAISPADTPIAGVTVTLYSDTNENGILDADVDLLIAVSNEEGIYAFENLPAGSYLVVETDPAGAVSVTDSLEPDLNTDNNTIHVIITNADSSDNDFLDVAPVYVIGDRVWLDEDADGIQDAGESGLANVTVGLYTSDGTVLLATTLTDAEGNYLFTGLAAGTYTVKVDTTSMAAGLVANPTFDKDLTLDHMTTATVGTGEGVFDADFGYNWAPTADVTGNQNTGAIGDRVWIDANGNGVQDPGEPGMGGVEVTLVNAGADGIFGTADDTTATTTTAADGSYVFDGLSAGAYQVSVTDGATGYLQTGDPDQPGALCSACDNKTTNPILLAPGDVYVNADFGFQPTANSGTVSGTLWFDADADATGPAGTPPGTPVDTTEPVIAGVTVALVKDSNGNGVWDAGETIIATTVTDASGNYAFTGLPATGAEDYLVWVNDTANVLAGLVPTYDNNGTGTPNLSTVSDLTTGGNALQDFGYTAAGQTATTGLIGDTIFLDRNNNGTPDAGEGIEGVTVGLYQSDGTTLITTTVTDENGHYAFGGLAVGTYVVKVDTATLPGSPSDPLANSYDPDGNTANEASVTLAAGQINLAQDFGYRDTTNPNTISGTIWVDSDADGTLDTGVENGVFPGVTVVLRDSNGDIVATTTTDANGNYTFSGLPDGAYTVDVTDEANVLDGLWHSTGTLGADNNSQTDPYTVAVSGGNTYPADFGYYGTPAALGDWVWADDGDGIQQTDERGIAGVVVQLTITWPGSATPTVVQTVTDANGYYSFENLLLDENLDGAGTGEPTYSISIPTYPGTSSDQNKTTEDLDSDNPAGTAATLIESFFDVTYDFGFYNTDAQTATISGAVYDDGGLGVAGNGGFDATDAPLPGVVVSVYRDLNGDGVPQPIELVGTTVTAADGTYSFPNLANGSYLVVETNPSGASSVTDADGTTTNSADLIAVTLTGTDVDGRNFLDDGTTTTSISGYVYDDGGFGATGDGAFGGSPADAPITGVIVKLYRDLDSDGVADANELVDTTATDAAGAYSFPNLPSGSYLVIETDPVGATSKLDTDDLAPPATATDNKIAVALASTPSTGNDFLDDSGTSAYTYAVSGTVYNDANLDGVINTPATGDTPISGVTVVLYADLNNNGIYDSADQLIATQTTDSSGNYSFPNIPSGEYLVIERDPAGFVSITDSGEPDPLNNSNVIAVTVNNADVLGNNFLDRATGTIGNYVWLDENGDGVQDAGEAGIANLTVALTGTDASGNAVSVTTVTDANGGYVFDHLPPSNGTGYTITVTPAAGLVPTYNEDTGITSPDHATTVVLAAGANHLDADFGYNWAPSTDVVNGTNTGAIGDRIWNDADGDGIQDPGETGLANVQVWLLTDDNRDGVYGGTGDNAALTATTDASGNYVFDGLPAGDYAVQVNSATLPAGFNTDPSGDPDTVLDGATGPIVLAPGDVYVNADFGYKLDTDGNPGTGADTQGGSRIGNLIFFDANGDGVYDADGADNNAETTADNEYGIRGVTVALLDASGNVIATTTTGLGGAYEFTGLPAGNYTVWVNDTQGVLSLLRQTADPDTAPSDELGLDSRDTLTVDGTSAYLDEDFGYTAASQTQGRGVIGDNIFFDANANGIRDAGGVEDMANVTVRLYDNTTGALIATTVTDPNGRYYFADLFPRTYRVEVDPTTLPPNLVNSTDPDGGTLNQSIVTIAADEVNLAQDFGYAYSGIYSTITGTLWNDADADGYQDTTETAVFPSVLVVLRDNTGDIIAKTWTDASGNYTFGYLPNGAYTVDVLDEANILDGLWHSIGGAGSEGSDQYSQADPYTVAINATTSGGTYHADFGYYGSLAAIGNRVWDDQDGNGIQDSIEPGLANVAVTLTIEYANGDKVVVATTTDANGYYRFENLLLDEQYLSGSSSSTPTAAQPAFTVSVNLIQPALARKVPAPADQGTNDKLDSDNYQGMIVVPVLGQADLTAQSDPGLESNIAAYDFGFMNIEPTLALFKAISATAQNGAAAIVVETASEVGSVAFDLYRQEADGSWTKLNADPVPASNLVTGGRYLFTDPTAVAGRTVTYRLIEWQTDGSSRTVGTYPVIIADGNVARLVSIRPQAGKLVVTWIGGKGPYRLEWSPSFGPNADWKPVTLEATDGTQATVPMAEPIGFFRVIGGPGAMP